MCKRDKPSCTQTLKTYSLSLAHLLNACSHICDPPHSLQWLFRRLWGQKLDPGPSLHLPCSHMLDPPHSLHLLFSRLWGQKLDPRHFLRRLFSRLCSHMLDPPHSLHTVFRRCECKSLQCMWVYEQHPGQVETFEGMRVSMSRGVDGQLALGFAFWFLSTEPR